MVRMTVEHQVTHRLCDLVDSALTHEENCSGKNALRELASDTSVQTLDAFFVDDCD